MTQETSPLRDSKDAVKTAIKSATNELEQERTQKLKSEIKDFLVAEFAAIDSLEAQIRSLSDEKRIHEENIKNVRSGNLEAVERRRETLRQSNAFTEVTLNTSSTFPYWKWESDITGGFTYISPSGRIFTI